MVDLKKYSTPSSGKPRVVWSIQGHRRASKSSICFNAPGPHLYLPFDFGFRGVVEKALARGKEIVWPKRGPYDFKYDLEKGQTAGVANVANEQWKLFRTDFDNGVKEGFRSITIDTASEAWHCFVSARYGKTSQIPGHLWGPLYFEFCNEFRSLLKADVNVFFIHQLKEENMDTVDAKGEKSFKKTGRWVKDGCKKMDYLVESNIEVRFEGGEFYATFLDCRQRQKELAGEEVQLMEDFSFQQLAMMVYPDVDPGVWE